MKLVICRGGIRAIYSDDLLPYVERLRTKYGLQVVIERATRVEPDPHGPGNWEVDLRPAGGPVCREDEEGRPFLRRQAAIDFELRWLEANWLGTPAAEGER